MKLIEFLKLYKNLEVHIIHNYDDFTLTILNGDFENLEHSEVRICKTLSSNIYTLGYFSNLYVEAFYIDSLGSLCVECLSEGEYRLEKLYKKNHK